MENKGRMKTDSRGKEDEGKGIKDGRKGGADGGRGKG